MIYAILLLLVGLAMAISPDARSPENIFNVLRQAVALGLAAIGQTVVILLGGIDLSVGATISMVAVYASGLMGGRAGIAGFAPPVLLAVGMALLVGLTNVLLITRLKVVPFIATLAMGSIVQGVVLIYAMKPVGLVSPELRPFAEGMIGPLPFPVVFLAIVVAITYFLLARTRLGRYIYATGGNERAARLSGIRTRRIYLFGYLFCSFMAALTALFLISRMGIGDPQVGGLNYERYDLDSIAAVLIGGTALSGGKGGVVGTIAGVLIIAILNNIFNLTGVTTFYQWIIKGLIILAAVAIYRLPAGKKAGRRLGPWR
jgi:ribose transport system permease protein